MPYWEIILIILGIVIIVVALVAIYSAPSLIRSRRLAKLARQLGLSFSDGQKNLLSSLLQMSGTKKNIIAGTINGHSVQAYDLQETVWQLHGNSMIIRKWVFILDGKEQQTKHLLRLLGLQISVRKIRKYLSTVA